MEQKLTRVPFDIELARKITNKEIEGRIFDNYNKCPARIVDFDFQTCVGKLNIIVSEVGKGKEVLCACNDDGTIYKTEEGKFNESQVFMLEIPGYLTFKDGDILSYEGGTFILKRIDSKDMVEYYASLHGAYTAYDSACLMKNLANHLRLAAEEEKQKLVDALKASKDTKAKEYLRRFFGIEEEPECKFNPFDKVLVRNSEEMEWIPRFFERIARCSESTRYITMDWNSWKYCIPYNEGTAHLIGEE